MSAVPGSRVWPAEGLARVPYWIYQDDGIYAREQERIYRGATWNFLGLEAELPAAGDFKTTFVGDMPVVVTRDEKGALNCFENRCAHRGALLCLKDRGNAKQIACVYHNWTYDLRGDLTSVAFRRGIKGCRSAADRFPLSINPMRANQFASGTRRYGSSTDI